jgi:hypothetical protein
MPRWTQTIEERLSDGLIETLGPLETPCWVWTKYCHVFGYGRIFYEGAQWYTHRLSWMLHFGPIPKDMLICHHCDNPPCCNPKHLYCGTYKDNMIDCVERNRHVPYFGGRPPDHSNETIIEARKLYAGGYSMQQVADGFGLSKGYISKLINGKFRKGIE